MNDAIFELTESFIVNLSSPTNAAITDGQGIGTILDNYSPPTLTISSFVPVA